MRGGFLFRERAPSVGILLGSRVRVQVVFLYVRVRSVDWSELLRLLLWPLL